jgi:hypothetical protein
MRSASVRDTGCDVGVCHEPVHPLRFAGHRHYIDERNSDRFSQEMGTLAIERKNLSFSVAMQRKLAQAAVILESVRQVLHLNNVP